MRLPEGSGIGRCHGDNRVQKGITDAPPSHPGDFDKSESDWFETTEEQECFGVSHALFRCLQDF